MREKGKVNVEALNGKYLTVPKSEVERIKTIYEQKSTRQALIEYVAEARSISKNSARRWVERQERKGMDISAMGRIALGLD